MPNPSPNLKNLEYLLLVLQAGGSQKYQESTFRFHFVKMIVDQLGTDEPPVKGSPSQFSDN